MLYNIIMKAPPRAQNYLKNNSNEKNEYIYIYIYIKGHTNTNSVFVVSKANATGEIDSQLICNKLSAKYQSALTTMTMTNHVRDSHDHIIILNSCYFSVPVQLRVNNHES